MPKLDYQLCLAGGASNTLVENSTPGTAVSLVAASPIIQGIVVTPNTFQTDFPGFEIVAVEASTQGVNSLTYESTYNWKFQLTGDANSCVMTFQDYNSWAAPTVTFSPVSMADGDYIYRTFVTEGNGQLKMTGVIKYTKAPGHIYAVAIKTYQWKAVTPPTSLRAFLGQNYSSVDIAFWGPGTTDKWWGIDGAKLYGMGVTLLSVHTAAVAGPNASSSSNVFVEYNAGSYLLIKRTSSTTIQLTAKVGVTSYSSSVIIDSSGYYYLSTGFNTVVTFYVDYEVFTRSWSVAMYVYIILGSVSQYWYSPSALVLYVKNLTGAVLELTHIRTISSTTGLATVSFSYGDVTDGSGVGTLATIVSGDALGAIPVGGYRGLRITSGYSGVPADTVNMSWGLV